MLTPPQSRAATNRDHVSSHKDIHQQMTDRPRFAETLDYVTDCAAARFRMLDEQICA